MAANDNVNEAVEDVKTPEAPVAAEGSDTPQNGEPTEVTRDPGQIGWVEPVPFNYESYQDQDQATANWAGLASRYEWKDEYGDVGPRNEELEAQLFRDEFLPRAGQRFEELNAIKVSCESKTKIEPIKQWEDAGLHPVMLENIELCMYRQPTAVQCWALPAIVQGNDLIAVAQTGSGKTAAFLAPILSKLMGKAKKLAARRPNTLGQFDSQTEGVRAEPLVLVVCPTRELATQIFDEARRLCYRSMLRPCVVYGGAPIRIQREELRRGCDILIGTPGRLLDFMSQPNVLSLRRVKFTVIDEADELLHQDWEEDFKKLMSGGDVNEDEDHQYMMFSATFDKHCRRLAREYLSIHHVRIRIGRAGSSHLNVQQPIIYVEEKQKRKALIDLLVSMMPVRTLIFVNNKQQVDFVDDLLYNNSFPSTSIHGDRTQREREDAIRAFRTARSPIMVATGLSARGLDIVNVMHVINYDLPRQIHGGITEYIHRIGRTARIGNEGIASSFYSEKDIDLAPELVKILLECKQPVPDFLQDFKPADGVPYFDDDTDAEDEDAPAVGQTHDDYWGATDVTVAAAPAEAAGEEQNENGATGAEEPASPAGPEINISW